MMQQWHTMQARAPPFPQPARSQSRRPPAGISAPALRPVSFHVFSYVKSSLSPQPLCAAILRTQKKNREHKAVRTPIHGSCPDLFGSKLQIALHILVTVRSIFCCAPEKLPRTGKQFFGGLSFPIWTAVLFLCPNGTDKARASIISILFSVRILAFYHPCL